MVATATSDMQHTQQTYSTCILYNTLAQPAVLTGKVHSYIQNHV